MYKFDIVRGEHFRYSFILSGPRGPTETMLGKGHTHLGGTIFGSNPPKYVVEIHERNSLLLMWFCEQACRVELIKDVHTTGVDVNIIHGSGVRAPSEFQNLVKLPTGAVRNLH